MSSRKVKHGKRRTRKARHAGHRLSNEEIENVRLSLLGVVATCELVRSSFAASRCTGIVLTRGALQPLREALTLLGAEECMENASLAALQEHALVAVGLPTTRERDRATARFDDRQRGQRVRHMMHGRQVRPTCLVEAHCARARLALLDVVVRVEGRRERNLA